jgi:hypothetical protein
MTREVYKSLLITAHYSPEDSAVLSYCTYDWRGSQFVEMTDELVYDLIDPSTLSIGDFVQIGPYRLRFVGRNEERRSCLFERSNSFLDRICVLAYKIFIRLFERGDIKVSRL